MVRPPYIVALAVALAAAVFSYSPRFYQQAAPAAPVVTAAPAAQPIAVPAFGRAPLPVGDSHEQLRDAVTVVARQSMVMPEKAVVAPRIHKRRHVHHIRRIPVAPASDELALASVQPVPALPSAAVPQRQMLIDSSYASVCGQTVKSVCYCVVACDQDGANCHYTSRGCHRL